MNSEEVLLKALSAKDSAVNAADTLQEFIDQLKDESSLTADAAAHAYMKAIGHLNDALASLNQLGVRRSIVPEEGDRS